MVSLISSEELLDELDLLLDVAGEELKLLTGPFLLLARAVNVPAVEELELVNFRLAVVLKVDSAEDKEAVDITS